MKIYKYILLLPLLLSACQDDSMRLDIPLECNGMEVRLQAEIDQLNLTRADDSGFADGDVIGVFAVDFVNGQPGKLSPTGNNADNVAFSYNEDSYRWSGASPILFSDDKTPIDLYGYYPYSKSVDNVEAYPISVEYNQSGDSKSRNMSAYEASDFLWAKSAGLTVSEPTAILYFKHVLASVRVTLMEGEGFAEGEWNDLDKSVLVCNTSRDATINLSTGEVKASSQKDGRSIVAKSERGDFRAIVIPQSVESDIQILKLTVGEHTYEFRKSEKMTFLPAKQHNFTMKVNKNNSNGDYDFILVDEAITAWESDLTSHDGEAKEYLVVEVSEVGSLENTIRSLGYDPDEIINLKICGPLNVEDFEFIRTEMRNMEAINLRDVDLSQSYFWDTDSSDWGYVGNGLPDYAFVTMSSLTSCVLPKNITGIGSFAFYGTSLSGSIEIPDGVEIIGDFAFSNYFDENGGYSLIPGYQYIYHNNLKGTLILPASIRIIGEDAFRGCDFSGRLYLPENLEHIGEGAFADCKHFTGDLIIPDKVSEIGENAFSGMTAITGGVTLPKSLKEIKEGVFRDTPINGIDWSDNISSFGRYSFSNTKMKGVFKIPESVVSLSLGCFAYSKIDRVIFPPNIYEIPYGCFQWGQLTDTLTIPNKVEVIGEYAFQGNKIDALVLPASLRQIKWGAFLECASLSYIRCDAKEPPMIDEGTFNYVEKDNSTVEVPEESVDAYRNAPGWCEFKRIAAYRNFVARPSKYNVLNKGGDKEVILNADADWELVDCPSWCHVDKSSGSKKTTLTLKVDAMSKGSPVREGKVTFRLKGSANYTTHINVCQYDYEYDEDQYLTLQSASKGKGINLVFLGDGYDAADISSGSYLSDMKQEMEYFFGVEPYIAYREYFNVYTAIAMSEDSGVEELNTWRKTKFHVQIGDGCPKDGQRLSADYVSALNYIGENIPPTTAMANPSVGCILVGNSDICEGLTYMVGDTFCSVVTKSTEKFPYDARGIVQHEAGGHGLGWLGDEYIYHNALIDVCKCQCCDHIPGLNYNHENGFALNLSLSGKYKDVPWSHLIFNNNYGDIVDIYEGGFFHRRGVYRSENNSCMNNNVPYFSTWSRQLIVQRIMKLAGEQFDLNSFYAKDSRAAGRDFTSTSRSRDVNADSAPVRHGHAPIKITGYKFRKKGGRK